jgi:tRNA(Arg) A34 adenosine deaminase TadA
MNDVTCHAEQNLMSAASRKFSDDQLSELVMVTSTEPCAMCSGATFWTGVRAVVYGLPETALCEMCISSENPNPPVLRLPCRDVFAGCAGHPTAVIGPVLEAEARVPHQGFWSKDSS